MNAVAPRTNYLVPTLLALLFVGPFVAAILIYFGDTSTFKPEGSVAHGSLLTPPGKLPANPATLTDGQTLQFTGRWSLIYVHGGTCAADCQEGLYRTRQVRKALGKENFRVQRLFVVADDSTVSDPILKAQHPDLRIVDGQVTAHTDVLNGIGAHQEGDVFIADPLGNVMLRFPADTAMKDMHKDLSLLLKASQIG